MFFLGPRVFEEVLQVLKEQVAEFAGLKEALRAKKYHGLEVKLKLLITQIHFNSHQLHTDMRQKRCVGTRKEWKGSRNRRSKLYYLNILESAKRVTL